MTQKWEDLDTNDWQYVWNTDNRLAKVTMTHQATQTQKADVEYAYDHQGARVLKRRLLADGAADGARTRYFFHGLTEEGIKRSVEGAKSIFDRIDKINKMKAIKSCESCKSCQNIYFFTGRRRACGWSSARWQGRKAFLTGWTGWTR